jgi:hypothetical protein
MARGKNALPLLTARLLKLVRYPNRIRGFISMGHVRAIINIEDLDIQTDIYKIVSQNLPFVGFGGYQESLKQNQRKLNHHQD